MLTDLFAPLPPAPLPDTPQAPDFHAVQLPAPQQPQEPILDYRARLLCHALAHGLGGLSLAELRDVDHGAAWAVTRLPGRIDQEETKHLQPLDRQLHDLRHAIHRRQTAHARAWAAIVAQLDQDEPPIAGELGADQDDQDEEAQPAQEETDQDRAVRLLRAGLTLLMGDQGPDDQDGGKGARLQRPIGPITPSGDALPQPGAPRRRF